MAPEPTGSAGASKRPGAGRAWHGLAVVATPIGNARDISLRALDAFAAADLVACEDTRVTAKLLALHGVRAPLFAYHDHNAERVRPELLRRLKGGETVALVSDAGTPLVSDPGFKLVRTCLEQGIAVTVIPGASAVLAALVVSGLPTDRFLFAGFLPSAAAARRRALAELAGVRATLVIMESPRRLAAALADMAAVLGARSAVVARELTKMFEEVRRGPLDELARAYRTEPPPKGEVTVVIAPSAVASVPEAADVDARLAEALGRLTLRDAVDAVAAATGLPRREVYGRALRLRRRPP